ncbi:MAG TPA: hypothetical protein VMY18_12800 [Acidobacteriota bacterium]|nr:hypothetical protein [Acidobacteriota bacterium]
MKRNLFLLAVFTAATMMLVAHPHLQKSIDVKIGEVEAKLSFYTSPANPEHVKNAEVGKFSTGYARLSISANLVVGGQTIPAGDYTVGAIRNGDKDWTMVLLPGKLGYEDTPDVSKVIKLKSSFSSSEGTAGHVDYNISPGHGAMTGQAVLVWRYGTLYLAGALTDAQ